MAGGTRAWMEGIPATKAGLRMSVETLRTRLRRGLGGALLIIKGRAMEYTPVDTSNLINGTYTETERQGDTIIGTIGYTAEYAPYVHENIKAHFKKPGARAKFLELALSETSHEVMAFMARGVRI